MMVGIQVGPIFYTVGNNDFLHAFFSTVAYRAEGNKWGSVYPILMNQLYRDALSHVLVDDLQHELRRIRVHFTSLPPQAVVWNSDDLDKTPPWKDHIADSITNLSDYFVTSDGKNMFDLFEIALETSKNFKKDIKIRRL